MADRALTVTFLGNDAQLQAAFKRVGTQLNTLQRTGDKLQSIGGSMTRNITVPLVAVGAAATKMASDFQSSTERLRTQAGATQKQVDKLRQGMLDMAGAVGQTPQQLSAGMYHVVSSMNAVLPPAQRASSELKILKVSAQLASVGGADLEETSYALASAMNALHAPISQTTKIAGEMNAIVGAGDMTFNDLLESLKSGLLPAAKQVGLSFQSVGAALAVMGDMGMRGSLAGTRLRMSIALLAAPAKQSAKILDTLGLSSKDAVATSEAMSAALKKAGLTTTTLAGDLKKPDGLMVALVDLKKHLESSGLTAEGAAAVMNKAFGGGKMGATITLLAQNTGRLQAKFDQIGRDGGKFGTSWKATTQTAAFQFRAMVASVQADGIKLGNAILPIVLSVAHSITGVVHSITDAFTSLPKGLQSTIIKGGLILATLGPAMKVLGMFTTAIGRLNNMVTGRAGAEIFGGGGGGGAAAGRTASTGVAASIRSGLGTALSRGFQGVSIAGFGSLISNMVGVAVKGSLGDAIKHIGTDTSIGAGIGAIFGPAGIAGGALIGGLVGSVNYFIGHDADRQGNEWASKFTSHLGGHISAAAQHGLAQATTNVINTPKPGSAQAQALSGNIHLVMNPGQQPNAAMFNQAFNKQFNQLYTAVKAAGQKAGSVFVQAWQTVKFPSEPILLHQMDQALNEVPKRIRKAGPQWVQEWKDQAAKQMLQYAVTLQQQGKLPISAVQGIMKGLERQIPGFSAYLSQQGITSDKAFAKALKFNQATATLKQTLLGYRKNFGDTSVAINLTAQNINSNVSDAMKHLKTIISTSTGDTRKAAVADFHALRDQTTASFSAMGSKVAQTAQDMAKSIKNGSSTARKDAVDNFAQFQAAVYNAMSSGSLSTSSGMSVITKALNATLKALGVKQIPVTTINPNLPNTVKQKSVGGAAQGGLWQIGRPGEAGHDSVPMNIGGHNVVVAPGEVAAVFNRHQLPVVNQALAPMGGLPGLFRNVKKPNYMASGGVVGGSGQLAAMVGEANAINSKHYPYVWGGGHNGSFSGPYDCSGAVSAVLHAGNLLSAPEVSGQLMSYGLPGPGPVTIYANPVHTFMSLNGRFFGTHGTSGAGWYAGGPRPGFAVRHAPVGAGAGEIVAPKVGGTGTVSSIARAALAKAAKGANSLIAKTLAKMTAGGSLGGGDWGTFGTAGGPTEAALAKALGAVGFDKVAIAGILGNVAQESQYGAASRNLFQFTPAIPGSSGSVAQQVALMMSHGGSGLLGALNSAGSPAAAAAMFMNMFERPAAWAANLANRQAQAQAAFAAGYAGGGLLGYAGGGIAARKMSPAMQAFVKKSKSQIRKPRHKAKKPRGPRGGSLTFPTPAGFLGAGGPFPFDSSDISGSSYIANVLNSIYGLDGGDGNGIGAGTGGDASKQWQLVDWFTNNIWPSEQAPNFSSIASPGDFIISQDALGNSIAPYISPRLDTVIGELNQAIGWQTKGVGDLYQAKTLSSLIQPAIRAAISRRVSVIAKIRKRAQDNLRKVTILQAKIKEAQKRITDANKRISTAKGAGPNTHLIASLHAQISAERTKKKPNKALIDSLYRRVSQEELKGPNTGLIRSLNADIKGWDGQIAGWTGQITGLQNENLLLTGSKTSIGSSGELGTIQKQLGATGAVGPIQAAENGVGSATGLYSLLSTVQGWGSTLGGVGGAIDQQNLTLHTWQANLAALGPGAQTALAAAQAQAGSSATPNTNPDLSALNALLQTQADQANFRASATSIELAQMASFLKESPPPAFGGSFAIGGVVPGLPGEPRTIIAHGGELVSDNPMHSRRMDTGGLIDALNAHTEAAHALREAVDQHNEHLHRLNSSNTGQVIKAFSDVINGRIGNQAHSRMTGSAGDGSVVRYR